MKSNLNAVARLAMSPEHWPVVHNTGVHARRGKFEGERMRRALSFITAGIIAVMIGGPIGTSTAGAQSASVNAFVEIGATSPAFGCAVDVSAEIRNGGAAVDGADVVVDIVDDGTAEVLASDRGLTDGSGVVWLSIDTSGAYDGAKTWLEVLVNGAYVGGTTLWVTSDGACGGESTLLDLSGDAPTVSDTTVDSDTPEDATGGSIIPNVFAYQQQRTLSCEYAAVSIATGMLGNQVSEYDMESQIGLSDNPHWGYRGSITGVWGNTTDYGIYAEALQPALAAFGFQSDVSYGGRDALISSVDQGRPSLVWLGLWGDTSYYDATSDGTSYKLAAGMHVMVAYGYDDGGVYLSDPGTGSLRYYDWGTFEWMWSVMDTMALSVYS